MERKWFEFVKNVKLKSKTDLNILNPSVFEDIMKKNVLEEKYINEVAPKLMEKFGYDNVMAIPRITKVSVNVGLSRAGNNQGFKEDVIRDLRLITGQKPMLTKARKAIAGFKIRENQEVGVNVTLRGKRMWDFVYKLIGATIPRMKDFQGIERKNFDNQGNFNFGIKEQLIFPEISTDDITTIFGLQVNITSSSSGREEGIELFKLLGFPIQEK